MRLIDADELVPDAEWDDYDDGFISYSKLQIDSSPTIEINKWHDLRKNQMDLPIYEKQYLCLIERIEKLAYEEKMVKEYIVFSRWQILKLKEFILKWQEIEQYEEI